MMLSWSSRYLHHGFLPFSKEEPIGVEHPWAPDEWSSGLVCADCGFDRVFVLGNGAEPSGGLEDPAREVGGTFPLRCRRDQRRLVIGLSVQLSYW